MQHRIWTSLLFPAIALFVMSWPLAAHHAFGSEFDSDRPVILKGKIVKIEWINPHVYMYADVAEEGGKVTGERTPSRAAGAGPQPGGVHKRGEVQPGIADADKKAWALYRQALRDLPKVCVDPSAVTWPTPPSKAP